MMSLNELDWVLAAIFLLGIVRGLWRGAISQVFGIAGVLGGFLLASHFYESVCNQIVRVLPRLGEPHLLSIISFALIFLLTWFCLSCLGYWLGSFFRRAGMGCLDRMLGAGVGVGKALIMAIILISSLTFLLSSDNDILRASRLAPYVQLLTQHLIRVTPPRVQQLFETKRQELTQYWLDHEKDRAGHGTKRKEPQ
jgi:membrane protein required for colicin V production